MPTPPDHIYIYVYIYCYKEPFCGYQREAGRLRAGGLEVLIESVQCPMGDRGVPKKWFFDVFFEKLKQKTIFLSFA